MTNRKNLIPWLLTSFPAAADEPNDIPNLIKVYSYAVEGISDRNLEATIRAFIQGKVDRNNAFRPSPAEIAAYARPLQMREDNVNELQKRVEARNLITDDWKPSGTEDQRKAHVEAAMKKLRTTMDTA